MQIVAVTLLFPAIVLIAAGTPVPEGLVRACRWSGAISFPLYVIHFPVIRLVAFFADRGSITDDLMIATVCVVASVGLAVAFVMVGRRITESRRVGFPPYAESNLVGSRLAMKPAPVTVAS